MLTCLSQLGLHIQYLISMMTTMMMMMMMMMTMMMMIMMMMMMMMMMMITMTEGLVMPVFNINATWGYFLIITIDIIRCS